MLTDAELLRRYDEDRSEAAFAELVQRHLDFVYSVALRHVGGDTHFAQDVAQKVFVDLAREAAPLSRRAVLRGWLYRSSQFRAVDVVRSERRRRDREQKAQAMNEISSSPASIDGDSLRPALDQAIGELSDRDRDVVLLRFFEGKAYADVAAAVHMKEDAARVRVDRALEKMRQGLARRGITSTTAALALVLANQTTMAAPAGLAAAVTGTVLASSVAGSSALIASAALWVGGALMIPAAGMALHEYQEAQRAHGALEAVTAERTVEMDRFGALETARLQAEKNHSGLLVRANALRTARAAAERKSDPVAEGQKLLAEFPQSRAMLIAAGISKVAGRYHPFYRLANLTPAQIEEFETLMATTWADSVTVTPATVAAGTPWPTEGQLRAILGDLGYEQYQNYSEVRYSYQFADLLATPVNLAGEPLSVGQIDQLAQIVAENSAADRGRPDPGEDSATFADALASVDWDNVMAQTKAILSPTQWRAAQGPLLNAQLLAAVAQDRKL